LPDIGSSTPKGCRWRQSRNVCQCAAADDAIDVPSTSDAATTASVTERVRATPARESATKRFSATNGAAVPATRSQSSAFAPAMRRKTSSCPSSSNQSAPGTICADA
jgi:hypothetical protein